MLRVKHIIPQMSESQTKQVREILAQDETYQEITLLIFDAYLENKSEEETRQLTKLELQAFKVFERVIYRTLLGYFNIEDTSVRDLLETSVFYALYGSTSKTNTEKSKELEQLFHQMKRHGVEQQSAELLEQLHQLNQNSPLEAVYNHLYKKYSEIEAANWEAIQYFEQLNFQLNRFDLLTDSPKGLISIYKKIRNINNNYNNQTSETIYLIAKAAIVLHANQDQLLKDGSNSLAQVLSLCKGSVSNLPFGFLRFYLQNIVNLMTISFRYQNNQVDDAKTIYSSCKASHLYSANNLNFPSKWVRAIKPLLEEKEVKLDTLHTYQMSIGKLRLNQAIESAFNKNYFGRERLSLFLN